MKFTAYDKGGILSAAKDVTRCLSKKETLLKQKEAIMQRALAAQQKIDVEVDKVDEEIKYYSQPVVDKTGYQPLDLVEKVGKGYIFKFPKTIIPEVETDIEQPVSIVEDAPISLEEETTPMNRDLDKEEDEDWENSGLVPENNFVEEEEEKEEKEEEEEKEVTKAKLFGEEEEDF